MPVQIQAAYCTVYLTSSPPSPQLVICFHDLHYNKMTIKMIQSWKKRKKRQQLCLSLSLSLIMTNLLLSYLRSRPLMVWCVCCLTELLQAPQHLRPSKVQATFDATSEFWEQINIKEGYQLVILSDLPSKGHKLWGFMCAELCLIVQQSPDCSIPLWQQKPEDTPYWHYRIGTVNTPSIDSCSRI